MHTRISIFLGTIVLLAGLLTGCGGGSGQSDQPSKPKGGQQETSMKEKSEAQQETKTATGAVKAAVPDKKKFRVKPKDGDAVAFSYTPEKLQVTLDGKKAKPEDIKDGQLATVKYTEKKGKKEGVVRRKAVSVDLKSSNK